MPDFQDFHRTFEAGFSLEIMNLTPQDRREDRLIMENRELQKRNAELTQDMEHFQKLQDRVEELERLKKQRNQELADLLGCHPGFIEATIGDMQEKIGNLEVRSADRESIIRRLGETEDQLAAARELATKLNTIIAQFPGARANSEYLDEYERLCTETEMTFEEWRRPHTEWQAKVCGLTVEEINECDRSRRAK